MLSDDAFGNLLTDTKRTLEDWAEKYGSAADIIIEDDPSFWRIQVMPHEAALCPIELVLRADRHYDLIVADAAVEDQPIERVALFAKLFDAVAFGQPVVRTYTSHATGQWLGDVTVVPLMDEADWRVDNLTTLGERLGLADAIETERRFAPYLTG